MGKEINVWDLQKKSVVATLNQVTDGNAIKIFMNDGRLCLARGDGSKIRLLME